MKPHVRVKAMNESVYYNVDDIHTAINQNKKIKFNSFGYNRSQAQKNSGCH